MVSHATVRPLRPRNTTKSENLVFGSSIETGATPAQPNIWRNMFRPFSELGETVTVVELKSPVAMKSKEGEAFTRHTKTQTLGLRKTNRKLFLLRLRQRIGDVGEGPVGQRNPVHPFRIPPLKLN